MIAMRFTKNSNFLWLIMLFIFSVFGLSLPFLNYHYGWFILIGFLPYLMLLKKLSESKYSLRTKVLVSWLAGFLAILIILGWLLLVDTSQWNIGGLAAIFFVGFIYLSICFVFSLQYVVFSWLFFRFYNSLNTTRAVIIIPSFWVVAEFFRSILFSVVAYGPGGSIGAFWNFGSLGFALGITPIGFSARFVGLWGLSFIAVALCIAMIWLFSKKVLAGICVIVLILSICGLGYVVYSRTTRSIRIGFIQYEFPSVGTNDSQFNTWKGALKVKLQSLSNNNETADILVLPEYSGVLDKKVFTVEEAKSLTQPFINPRSLIVSSEVSADRINKKNILTLANHQIDILASYEKTFLIPTGEYRPFIINLLLKLTKQVEVEKSQENYEITKGKNPSSVLNGGFLKIAAQVCSGAIAPELFREQVKNGGEIMTNSGAIASLMRSRVYHEQSLQTARFIAIANNRSYVQAAFGTYSFIFDKNGNIVKLDESFNFRFDNGSVDLAKNRTLYTLIGEWVVMTSIIITALVLLRKVTT